MPYPASILTFVTGLALLYGAITQWLGVHAILGFFLAGIMAGNTSEISEQTRDIISKVVHAVSVPIFFAGIGLKIDFAANFHLYLVLLFTGVAIGGKLIGAFLGAAAVKVPRKEALSIGIAFIPGGAMEVILGMLALELRLIEQHTFVAIVFAALFFITDSGASFIMADKTNEPSLKNRTIPVFGCHSPFAQRPAPLGCN